MRAFDTLAEALEGETRLRELVLQLAVRGKLVPQDTQEGRAPIGASPPEEGKEPFEIPETWSWMRLPEVADYAAGKTPPTKDPRYWGENQIPWVSIGDMTHGGTVLWTKRTVTQTAASSVFRKPIAPAGTLLMSFKLTIGKVALLGVDAYHNEAIISIHPAKTRIARDYLMQVIPMMAKAGESKAAIMGSTLNRKSLARVLVPLPPLAEQHRIVARVDELMGLLDRLEAARTARDTTRAASRDAALAALREADTPEEVEVAWNRFAERMDDLLCDPADIKPLRQAVLQLAVRGKLVPQDAGDEPASVLFRRVVAQKRGMEEAGEIKKQKPVLEIKDAEILFSIPPTWKWVRAADISYPISSGSTPKKSFFQAEQAGGVPYLKVYNIRGQRIDFDYKRQFIDETHHMMKMKRSILVPGMVVLNIVGPPLGKTAIIPDSFPEWNCNQAIAFFRCIGDIQPTYLHLYLMAGVFLRNIPLVGTAGQDNLSVTKCKHIVVPLPPVAEQHRIVARVDELMGLLDRLEARLTVAQVTHGSFASAAVHHLDT